MNRGRILGPGKLRKQKGLYVLDWTTADGKRERRALSHDRRTAERIRTELLHRRDLALAGLGADAGQSMPLVELRDLYLADLRQRASERHAKNTATKLARVIEGIGVPVVRDLKPMLAVRHRTQLLAAGMSRRTANLDVAVLKAALTWALDNELIASNPLAGVKPLAEGRGSEKRPRRALSDHEIDRFLSAASSDDERWDHLRKEVRIPQAPFWRALLETGARYGELTKATWGDADLDGRMLALRAANTKSKRERVVPLSEALARELFGLKVLREQRFGRLATVGEPIFLTAWGTPHMWHTSNVTRTLNRILKRAGISKVTVRGKIDVHSLRHTFASRLARAGVGLVKAQRLLGHSDPKLTAEIYTHLEPEDLRDAIDSITDRRGPGTDVGAKEAR